VQGAGLVSACQAQSFFLKSTSSWTRFSVPISFFFLRFEFGEYGRRPDAFEFLFPGESDPSGVWRVQQMVKSFCFCDDVPTVTCTYVLASHPCSEPPPRRYSPLFLFPPHCPTQTFPFLFTLSCRSSDKV